MEEQSKATPKEIKAHNNLVMFVDIKLNGMMTHTLVDIRATHNFIMNRDAK